MPARIGVEIVADATKLLKAFSTSAKASSTFTKELTVDSRVAAEAQVRGAVKTSEALKTQAVAYRQLAASVERGSAEQVAAARLAERAEQRLARSMGVTAAEATHLERNLGRATRGALSGAGVFRGFTRSLAFASGGFLAFEGVSRFLTDSINAAREAAVSQRSLAAQMKAGGESFQANREQIEKASLAYGKFGFQNDEVVAGLTVLDRGTGNVNKSLGLLQLTADLARAKQLRFADAAQIVAKVFGRQETALRRAVPGLPKYAHGMDLIRLAAQKMTGQAAANTISTERFAATLHNTEEIIGAALLPTLNTYLGQLTKWLNNTDNQVKLQKDMTAVAGALATAFDGLATAIGGVTSAWDKLPDFGKHKGLLDLLPGGHKSLLDVLGITGGGGGVKAITGGPDVEAFLKGIRRNAPAVTGGPAGQGVRRPLGLAGRFNLAELKLAQAQLTKTQADDRRILVVEQAIVEQQIKQAKSLKDRIRLTQQLAGIVGQIRGIDQQTADAIKQQTQARKDAAKQAADAAKAAAKAAAAQRALFTMPAGLELAEAKAAATGKPLLPTLKKMRDAARKALRSGRLSIQSQIDAWNEIASLNDQIKQATDGVKKAKPPTIEQQMQRNLNRVLAMSPKLPPPGLRLPGQGGVVIHGGVHLHGVQDVPALEQELQKRSKARQQPRRGH